MQWPVTRVTRSDISLLTFQLKSGIILVIRIVPDITRFSRHSREEHVTGVNNRLLLPCILRSLHLLCWFFVFLERRNLFSVSNLADSREDICYLYIVGLSLISSNDNAGHDGYRLVTWFFGKYVQKLWGCMGQCKYTIRQHICSNCWVTSENKYACFIFYFLVLSSPIRTKTLLQEHEATGLRLV
jgi:hypothetical protein